MKQSVHFCRVSGIVLLQVLCNYDEVSLHTKNAVDSDARPRVFRGSGTPHLNHYIINLSNIFSQYHFNDYLTCFMYVCQKNLVPRISSYG